MGLHLCLEQASQTDGAEVGTEDDRSIQLDQTDVVVEGGSLVQAVRVQLYLDLPKEVRRCLELLPTAL